MAIAYSKNEPYSKPLKSGSISKGNVSLGWRYGERYNGPQDCYCVGIHTFVVGPSGYGRLWNYIQIDKNSYRGYGKGSDDLQVSNGMKTYDWGDLQSNYEKANVEAWYDFVRDVEPYNVNINLWTEANSDTLNAISTNFTITIPALDTKPGYVFVCDNNGNSISGISEKREIKIPDLTGKITLGLDKISFSDTEKTIISDYEFVGFGLPVSGSIGSKPNSTTSNKVLECEFKQNQSVIAYFKKKGGATFKNFVSIRCDENGKNSDDGKYIKTTFLSQGSNYGGDDSVSTFPMNLKYK